MLEVIKDNSGSSNGRTLDFESNNEGSTPSPEAIKIFFNFLNEVRCQKNIHYQAGNKF